MDSELNIVMDELSSVKLRWFELVTVFHHEIWDRGEVFGQFLSFGQSRERIRERGGLFLSEALHHETVTFLLVAVVEGGKSQSLSLSWCLSLTATDLILGGSPRMER
ncbi:hypothetical protein YC2023_015864 [Brassica napus]